MRAVIAGATLSGAPAAVVMQVVDGDPPMLSVLSPRAVLLDDRAASRALDHMVRIYLELLDHRAGRP